jgi:O-acetyl-ADP-ribose deacetylase (regulator of RNase III)
MAQPMVRVIVGNVLDSSAQTPVNTVNCAGVMGKGIALEFKKRFPDMFKDYAARGKRGEVRLGEPYLFPRLTTPWILNFPTKGHWRDRSRESAIVAGLQHLEGHYRDWGIESLAMPPLGCGNGGLQWDRIGPILFDSMSRIAIPVELYAPPGTPQEQLTPSGLRQARMPICDESRLPSRIEPADVALVAVLARIEDAPYHRRISRTAFEAIACFATVAGLPTGLTCSPGRHGVSGRGLRAIVTRLASNGVLLEQQAGGTILVGAGPEYTRVAAAFKSRLQRWEHPIERATDLFLRTASDREAERVADILLAAGGLRPEGDAKPSERDVLDELKRWRRGRRGLPGEADTAVTVRDLATLDWIDVEPSPDLPLPEELAVEA